MRFGFGTILWGRRIDDLDYALDVIKACGYQGVEIAQHHSQIFVREKRGGVRPLRDVSELLKKLKDRDLDLIGLVAGSLRERMDFLGNHRSPYLYLDRWPKRGEDELFHKELTECLDGGFTIMLHPHWLMQIRKLSHAKDIIQGIGLPNVRLLLDTAHVAIAEENPVEFLESPGCFEMLGAVHLKDWRPDYGRWSHRYAHGFCLPGDGIVKPEKVMDVLAAKGFAGWVIFEQDHYYFRREATVLEGAEWMQRHGVKWGISVEAGAKWVADSLLQDRPSPFSTLREFDELEFMLGKELSRTVAPCPDGTRFYAVVAGKLRAMFDAAAVKVWSYNSLTGEFCLLGIDAVEESLLSSEHIIRDRMADGGLTLAGHLVVNPHTCEWDLKCQKVRASFADQDWLARVKGLAEWMTVIPVFNTSNYHQLRFFITLFSRDSLLDGGWVKRTHRLKRGSSRLKMKTRHEFERLGWVVSHWADFLTDQVCSAASGATNHLCGNFVGGVPEFTNALMAHLQAMFDCNSVTIFLKDMTGKRLEPAGNSNDRLNWSSAEKFYRIGDGRTGSAFKEREMIFCSHARDGTAREQRPAGDPRDEILFAPLVRRDGECHGVVRLHNKNRHLGVTASSMFTDDDAAKLDAVIQTALPYLELLMLKERQSSGIARMIHEFQAPLVAIRGAVDAMRRDLRNNGRVWADVFRRDFSELIVQWAAHAGRLAKNWMVFAGGEGSLPLKKQKTHLRADVIVPVLHQIRGILTRGVNLEFSYGRFDDVPPLLIDRDQFQQVFFNLLTNSCKYGREFQSVQVDINSAETDDYYVISFSDWGGGVSDELKEQVFLPGFRAKSAISSNMLGQGLGLFVVRSIVEAHGGSIRIAHTLKPTTFEILLPKNLRYGSRRPWHEYSLKFPK